MHTRVKYKPQTDTKVCQDWSLNPVTPCSRRRNLGTGEIPLLLSFHSIGNEKWVKCKNKLLVYLEVFALQQIWTYRVQVR